MRNRIENRSRVSNIRFRCRVRNLFPNRANVSPKRSSPITDRHHLPRPRPPFAPRDSTTSTLFRRPLHHDIPARIANFSRQSLIFSETLLLTPSVIFNQSSVGTGKTSIARTGVRCFFSTRRFGLSDRTFDSFNQTAFNNLTQSKRSNEPCEYCLKHVTVRFVKPTLVNC